MNAEIHARCSLLAIEASGIPFALSTMTTEVIESKLVDSHIAIVGVLWSIKHVGLFRKS